MKKTKKVAGRTSRGFLIPDPEALEKWRRKLPHFRPHDLTVLLSETRSQGLSGKKLDEAVVLRMRQINDAQLKQLVSALGVESVHSDFWQRAFFLLAHLHHGVGHLSVRPKKTNRNAAVWTLDHDQLLIREMLILKSQGLSDRKAIEKLASDSRKGKLFPHRAQMDTKLLRDTKKQHKAALRHRWQTIKAASSIESLGRQLGYSPGESDLERTLLAVTYGTTAG